ncbi:MAG TPA: type II and III secretion system protein family protein [Phenylobacterium sp.]|nr:type II and III secretion system protein family protein [Phenylobacterium sp.]
MKTAPNLTRAALAALVVLAGAAAPLAVARAETLASEPVMRRTIHVPRDKSLSFRLPAPASKIVVAQPDIAKVTGTSDASFYVQGIDFGSTNLLVYGKGGQLAEVIDIRVGYDSDGLQQDLEAAFPGERIAVRNLGEVLMLTGEVSTTGVQASAEDIARKYAPEAIISRITTRASEQVILEVRILEASRTALQDVGVDLNVFNKSFNVLSGQGLIGVAPPQTVIATHGGSGNVTINTALEALEEKGIVRTLAKPNLVAISGEKASFLAGGEFPFPVPEGLDKVVIQFRPYGVKLNFTPIVQENGWIRLAVEPEVSQLDPTNAVTVQGLTVPALTVRRASTTMELRPGDSFAMAGLFQHAYQNDAQQMPGLGSIPVLGALFRSARWKRDETELLIVVTPRLATPEDHHAALVDHIGSKEPTATDLFLLGKSGGSPTANDPAPTGKK